MSPHAEYGEIRSQTEQRVREDMLHKQTFD